MACPSQALGVDVLHDVGGGVHLFDLGICCHSVLISIRVVIGTEDFLRILLSKYLKLVSIGFVSVHVSHPHMSTSLITVLKILIFEVDERFLDLMVLLRVYKHLFAA